MVGIGINTIKLVVLEQTFTFIINWYYNFANETHWEKQTQKSRWSIRCVYTKIGDLLLFMCLCVYVLVSVNVCHTFECPHRPEEGDGYSRAGLTGSKPPDVDGGESNLGPQEEQQIWLCKNKLDTYIISYHVMSCCIVYKVTYIW